MREGALTVGPKCRLCSATMVDREELVRHLKEEHEPIEVVSFAAMTMVDDQNRDSAALEFNRRFQKLREILTE